MMKTTTSLSLLESIRNERDQRAWAEFFRRYAPMLLGFAKRMGLADADANDAVQETLLAVHATFREMSGPFDRSKGRFKAWLRGIAKHKVHDVQRRRVRAERVARRFAESEGRQEQTDDPPSAADELFEREWQRNLLARVLQQVSREVDPAVYQAFELYAVHGQKAEQVAKLLGISRNAVYISKTRVLQRVRAALRQLEQEEG
jgi:RNA polymerase sigma-70 factor (ECF subfamily)